jgi:hypothetical protein
MSVDLGSLVYWQRNIKAVSQLIKGESPYLSRQGSPVVVSFPDEKERSGTLLIVLAGR